MIKDHTLARAAGERHGAEGMRDLPIIFSAPMVRAILEGRKTQTRRIVDRLTDFRRVTEFQRSRTPGFDFSCRDSHLRWHDMKAAEVLGRCPFGQPGDRLWVRENFYQDGQWCLRLGCEPDDPRGGFWSGTSRVIYAADGTPLPDPIPGNQWRSRPSIHMPRLLSRITLEITDVRVERLQDISGMDAKREGVSVPAHLPHDGADLDYARREYRRLWQSINGPESWDANPWVWVIEFKKLEQA